MSHYSLSQKPDLLKTWADSTATQLITKFHGTGKAPLLMYRGFSGAGMATALGLALYQQQPEFRFGMVYVRKHGDQSHGDPVESEFMHERCTLIPVFVDDFISSGATLKATLDGVKGYMMGSLTQIVYGEGISVTHRGGVKELKDCAAFRRWIKTNFYVSMGDMPDVDIDY